MKARFQADADLNHNLLLAVIRQQPGIDFRSAVDAQLAGLTDLEVLSLAAREDRILVTHDLKTMPRHFAAYIASHLSAGVLLVPQHLPISTAAEQLILIWSVTDAPEWTNRIVHLPL